MYARPHPVARYPVREAIEQWLIARLGITIDGTTVSESTGNITIDGTDVTEVTVDGTTVWTADAIPDSAVSQFKVDEGTGSTLNNEFAGQPDGTINGPTWSSDADLEGGWGLDFDGLDDWVEIASDFAFADNGEQFSFAVTVTMTDLSIDQAIWKHWPSSGGAGFVVGTGNTNPGKLCARYYNGTSNAATVSTTSATTSRLRLGVAFDAVNDAVTIFINGSDVGDGTEYSNLGNSGTHTLGRSGSGSYADMVLDNPIWYDELLSSSEFTDDYNAQPWP